MKINIAETTDKEIQDIINDLIKNENYSQIDETYIEVNTPFEINPLENQEWKNKIGLTLYPELLNYYEKRGEYMTVPWICIEVEIERSPYVTDEAKQRELCKWLVSELQAAGHKPFKDEDAFAEYFSKEDRKGYVILKMYTNPSYPSGYWLNHTL